MDKLSFAKHLTHNQFVLIFGKNLIENGNYLHSGILLAICKARSIENNR